MRMSSLFADPPWVTRYTSSSTACGRSSGSVREECGRRGGRRLDGWGGLGLPGVRLTQGPQQVGGLGRVDDGEAADVGGVPAVAAVALDTVGGPVGGDVHRVSVGPLAQQHAV